MNSFLASYEPTLWEREECLVCHVRRQDRPNIQFLFTTCCGAQLCRGCADSFARKRRERPKCPSCQVVLPLAFSDVDMAHQTFDAERKIREQLSDKFCLTQEDFDSEDAHEDYLELVEDVVYALTQGTDHERIEAQARLRRHVNEHAEIIAHKKELRLVAGLDVLGEGRGRRYSYGVNALCVGGQKEQRQREQQQRRKQRIALAQQQQQQDTGPSGATVYMPAVLAAPSARLKATQAEAAAWQQARAPLQQNSVLADEAGGYSGDAFAERCHIAAFENFFLPAVSSS